MNIEDVKIGMNVLCIDRNGYAYIQKGTIYEVCELDDYNHIGLKGIYGGVCVYHTGIFEPVPEPVVHKFHVCQPVRCITDILHPIKFGDVNIIRGINDEHEGHSLSFVAFPDNRSWMSQHFEPAYKLEVGCKVMLKCDHSQKGKITSMKSEDYLVGVLWDGAEYPITAYNPDDFIVLEPAPKFTDFKTYSKHLFEAGNIITKEEFDKEYRHTLDELTGVTRGYDWGNISHKSPFDDCTYQSEKIYQDIEKCLEDIKKEPLDKYGKWALEHYDSIIANRDWAGMLNHVDCMCVIVPITSIMEENKMEIQQINHRKIVDEITGEPVTAVGIHEGLFPLYITKENKYILLKEHYDVEITPDDIKKIMKDKSKELSKLYYSGFTYGFIGYSVEKVK